MAEDKVNGQEQQERTQQNESGEEKQKSENKAEERRGFSNFVNESARLATSVGSTLGETFKGLAGVFRGRNHVVMVRVNYESLKPIDQLVDAGIFRSRSESAAFLIARGIAAEESLFTQLESRVEEINRLRQELRDLIVAEEEGEAGS